MVARELLDDAAAQQAKVDRHLEQRSRNAVHGRLAPGVFGGATPLPDALKVRVEVLGPNAIRSRHEGREKPIKQKIAKQKFVARDVPEQERLPFVHWAAALCQESEWAIASVGVEPAVQHFGDITEPCGRARANEVLLTETIKILTLRKRKIPCSKHSIRLVDHRSLNEDRKSVV